MHPIVDDIALSRIALIRPPNSMRDIYFVALVIPNRTSVNWRIEACEVKCAASNRIYRSHDNKFHNKGTTENINRVYPMCINFVNLLCSNTHYVNYFRLRGDTRKDMRRIKFFWKNSFFRFDIFAYIVGKINNIDMILELV